MWTACVTRTSLLQVYSSVHLYVTPLNLPCYQLRSSVPQVLLTLNNSPKNPPISIIARLPSSILPRLVTTDRDSEDARTIVAIRQGRHFLTTFHPELTKDDRFHDYFVRECVLPEMVWI